MEKLQTAFKEKDLNLETQKSFKRPKHTLLER